MRWDGTQEYPVYVINRECDGGRLARFAKSCAKWGVEFERVDAVNCADPNFDYRPYDSQIADTFYGKQEFLRGAVGCFLSHVKAWQKLLDSGFSHALICEDDARWLGPIPRRVAQFGMPSEFDMVFVNQRMNAGGFEKNLSHEPAFHFTSTFNSGMSTLAFTGKLNSVGTDGYLMSRVGARTALCILANIKISMEVDWFLFFHTLSGGERRKFIETDGTARFDALEFAALKLNAAVVCPSLVDQWDNESTIAFDNPKNYVSKEAMRGASTSMFPTDRG